MSLLFSIALATIPALPEPVANNAVAKVVIDEQAYFLSFMGLSSGKAHTDVHNKVWVPVSYTHLTLPTNREV